MSETEIGKGACANRREFLLSGGITAAMMMLGTKPMMAEAKVVGYPRKKIGKLSRLKSGRPIDFNYPDEDSENILVKLSKPAGGGVGKNANVVAFNKLCTHMGGTVTDGGYHHSDAVAGPCPFHLSTFDLSRHGMIVAGHATQSLPQIQLEVKGDDIYAVGVMGLIYGRNKNLG
jgi:arsenite oxidase small subunit